MDEKQLPPAELYSKTEALLVGTPHQIRSSPISQFIFDDQVITICSSLNRGVRFDPQLTFNDQNKSIILKMASFHHLRNISKLHLI